MSATAFALETAPPIISVSVIVTVTDTEPEDQDLNITRVGRYRLSVEPEILELNDPAIYLITWSFKEDTFNPTFLNPGVIFAQPTAPALTQGIGDRKKWTVHWSNEDPKNRHSWPYNLHVRIGDQLAVLDPTVENQPPLDPPTS